MKKVVIGIIVVLLIIVTSIFILTNNSESPPNLSQSSKSSILSSYEIEMSSTGFSPSAITIKAGEKVTFIAIDSSNRWPATASHPTHTVYPGSDIQKCETSEKNSIFDACKGVSQGATYEFTFNEKGTWNYHDHLQPSKFGKIIVE